MRRPNAASRYSIRSNSCFRIIRMHKPKCNLAPNHPQTGTWAPPNSVFKASCGSNARFSGCTAEGLLPLVPGNKVRLRYAYVIECTGFEARYLSGKGLHGVRQCADGTRSGTPGADSVKVKGNIHWLCTKTSPRASVRLYDRFCSKRRIQDVIQEIFSTT